MTCIPTLTCVQVSRQVLQIKAVRNENCLSCPKWGILSKLNHTRLQMHSILVNIVDLLVQEELHALKIIKSVFCLQVKRVLHDSDHIL